MKLNPEKHTSHQQRSSFIAINFLLVSAMLACFAFFLGQFIETIYPEWSANFFPVLAFLIAIESLYQRHIQRKTPRTMQNPIITIMVELVLILLFIKFASMLISGFSTIWIEMTTWPENFIPAFFNAEYVTRAFGLLLIWALSWGFSQPINQLEEDEELLEQEKLGYTFNDRQIARQKLITLTFVLGLTMIVLMVIMNSALDAFTYFHTPHTFFLPALIIYFALAFLFLSFNQYAILKIRWFFNDINVQPDLTRQWLIYAVIFILAAILIATLLPTGFTMGFYPVARFISEVVVFLFSVLQFLIMVPLALLISLLNDVFPSVVNNTEPFLPTTPEISPTLPSPTTAMPWWDVVKSIAFWVTFLGIIVFAITYYFNNRPNLKSIISRVRMIEWFKTFLIWIKQSFKKIRQVTAETYRKGTHQIRAFINKQKLKLPSWSDIAGRLAPRQLIILIYLDWIRWNARNGIKREKSHTPLEFSERIAQTMPDQTPLVDRMTELFVQARYTNQLLNKTQAQEMETLSKAFKSATPSTTGHPEASR